MLRISDIPVISLDLETGGLVPGKHTPLSIGAVMVPGSGPLDKVDGYKITKENSFYVQLEWDTVVIDPSAMRINRLNIVDPPGPEMYGQEVASRSLPAKEGVLEFFNWLASAQTTSRYVHALGMNVGSFDLPMLRSIWNGPWPFHYRSIDLNSLFFALSQIQNKPFDAIKQEITQIAWDNNEFSQEMEHYALADAWFNVYAWKECLRRFGDGYEELL
jgi:hypothetical protein